MGWSYRLGELKKTKQTYYYDNRCERKEACCQVPFGSHLTALLQVILKRKHFLFAQETASYPGGDWVRFLSQHLFDLMRKQITM